MTGNDLGLTIRSAATDAVGSWRELVALGRPRDWAWTAIPFLVGAWDAARGPSVGILLALLYLLLPFWLARHGAADLATGRSGLAPATTWFAIGIVTVPLIGLIAIVANPLAALVLAGLTALAIVDRLPPAEAHARPGLDLAVVGAAALLLALSGPLAAGAVPAGLPWLAALAFAAWSVGMTTIERMAGETASDGARQSPRGTVAAVGPFVAGWMAVADIALAVVLLALLGGLGWLAALGVAAHLLIALMPVTRGRGAATVVAGARDAWRERAGLDVLVGGWLAVLLAWHWGVAPWDAWTVLVVVAAAAAGWSLATTLLTRLTTRRRDVGDRSTTIPSLAIVVPCRDDADRLPACLAALREQTYADTTIIVVDAGSADGSADEAAAWIGEDDVVVAPPTPDGWEPRAWARRVGVEAVEGDLVLFVAPDTILAPIAARILVEHLEAEGLDALSGLPRDLMPTFGEQAAVPGFAMALVGLLPLWFPALTPGRPSRAACAARGLRLVRRSAYLAAAEPAADATAPTSHLAEGRRLAVALVEHGARIGLVHAARLAARRRATSIGAVLGTWRRRTAHGGQVGLAAALVGMIAWLVVFALPLVLPLVAVVAGGIPEDLRSATALPLAFLLAARLVLAITQHQPPLTLVFHPVTVVLATVGQAAGVADRVRGRRAATVALEVEAEDAGSVDASPSRPDDDGADDPFGDLPELWPIEDEDRA